MKNPEMLSLGSTLIHGMPQQSVIDLPKNPNRPKVLL